MAGSVGTPESPWGRLEYSAIRNTLKMRTAKALEKKTGLLPCPELAAGFERLVHTIYH